MTARHGGPRKESSILVPETEMSLAEAHGGSLPPALILESFKQLGSVDSEVDRHGYLIPSPSLVDDQLDSYNNLLTGSRELAPGPTEIELQRPESEPGKLNKYEHHSDVIAELHRLSTVGPPGGSPLHVHTITTIDEDDVTSASQHIWHMPRAPETSIADQTRQIPTSDPVTTASDSYGPSMAPDVAEAPDTAHRNKNTLSRPRSRIEIALKSETLI